MVGRLRVCIDRELIGVLLTNIHACLPGMRHGEAGSPFFGGGRDWRAMVAFF